MGGGDGGDGPGTPGPHDLLLLLAHPKMDHLVEELREVRLRRGPAAAATEDEHLRRHRWGQRRQQHQQHGIFIVMDPPDGGPSRDVQEPDFGKTRVG
jgi:hypothetical protein